MQDSKILENQWNGRACPWRLHHSFAITEKGVTLGADTLIAPAVKDAYGRTALAIDGNEERILALLSVAHDRPVSPAVLDDFRAASRALAKGDKSLALICLAQSGLPALDGWDGERNARNAAKALFMTDRVLQDGMDAGTLLKGLDLLPDGLSPDEWRVLAKYNDNHDERGRFASTPGGGGSKASLVRTGGGAVVIDRGDGTVETREGGSRAWRNNNPGNLNGPFADRHGAIGRDSEGFAVFPDEETGNAAMTALLQSPSYSYRTVDGAIEYRSPPKENNTAELQRQIRDLTGLRGDTVVGTLDQQSLERLGNAIRRTEGWREGKSTRRKK